MQYGFIPTHDITATHYRWLGQWGITHRSEGNKSITRQAHAVLDDFGNLVELSAEAANAGAGFRHSGQSYFDHEVDAETAHFNRPQQPQAKPRACAEVIEAEGEWPEIALSPAHEPIATPHYRISVPYEETLVLSRGQLLALISAAAPLLGLEISTTHADAWEAH